MSPQIVAVKRLHDSVAHDPEFRASPLDEARLTARIHHLNVVSAIDVAAFEGQLCLAMEYVHGESLSTLWRAARARGNRLLLSVVVAVMSDVCRGLHAAHEARGRDGTPLRVVHRDVSPQNILIGVDGVGRLIDFGVAKALGRAHTTQAGVIKGKVAYMAPEQLMGTGVTRQADIYSAGVVLWELLTGRHAFVRADKPARVRAVLHEFLPPPSAIAKDVPRALDAVVLRALEHNPYRRYATAQDMGRELQAAVVPARSG